MKTLSNLTAEYVRSILDYDPDTGIFRWRVRSDVPREWNARRAGKIAGGKMMNGYWFMAINNQRYLAHRLAWLWVTGAWPKADIDHANLKRDDNRFANLRDASSSENHQNRRPERGNASGIKGVSLHKASGLWFGEIRRGGKRVWCGYFRRKRDAAKAISTARKIHHGAFARDA